MIAVKTENGRLEREGDRIASTRAELLESRSRKWEAK